MNKASLSDFDLDLPPELIAQFPVERRGESRLLTLDGTTGELADRRFADLPDLVRAGDLLVLNDTRVVKARLFAEKSTGGKLELLVERILGPREALALVRASHPPQPGAKLYLKSGDVLSVVAREEPFHRMVLDANESFATLLEREGEVPLPPYIERRADARDEARYQTVYAREPGAVAAPTAGLHFDEAMLCALRARGVVLAFVTLHVGAGTFQPVRSRDISLHRMHAERYRVPADTLSAIARTRQCGGRVTAVGTTSLRALEAQALRGQSNSDAGETDLFITPGFSFRVVDRLVTNFHLPRSTLLMLVAAFAGLEHTLHAYRHAVDQRYAFFSYGDAMLIDRARAPVERCAA